MRCIFKVFGMGWLLTDCGPLLFDLLAIVIYFCRTVMLERFVIAILFFRECVIGWVAKVRGNCVRSKTIVCGD